MIFRENAIFKLENKKYRIVGNDSLKSNIFVIELCKEVRWPHIIRHEELEYLCKNNEAVEVRDDKFINIKNNEITDEMLKKRNFHYEIVCYLFETSPNCEIFYKKSRKCLIDKAMEAYKVSESSIKRMFCNYLKGAKTIDSLIPKTDNCGARGKERTIKNRQGLIIDNEIKRIFKKGINKYYNTSRKNSKKVCIIIFIYRLFKN